MSLGYQYVKALQGEVQESFERQDVLSQESGYRNGLRKAIQIIEAIDKHEMDNFMNKLLNGIEPDGLDEI